MLKARARRPRGETSVFVVDSDTSEVLHYEAVAAVPATTRVDIPREKLNGRRNVDVRNDLIDCGIDVCALEVRIGLPSTRHLI